MDPLHLKSFLHIMRTGSFSKAAKASFRSQPVVSRHIQALESKLGVRLFERFGPMRVRPTKEAAILEELALPALNQFESIKSRLDERRDRTDISEMKIATHESAKMPFLIEVLSRFQRRNPQVKIILTRKGQKEVVAMVLEGSADFGITSIDKVPPGIRYRIFALYNRVLMVPKDHLFAKRKNVSLEDIAKGPLILPPTDSNLRKIVDKAFKKAKLKPNVALEITGRGAAKAYVAKGFGLSVINEYYMMPSDAEKIRCVDASEHFGHTKRGVIQRKDRKLSDLHDRLIENILSKKRW